jgi:hypothetical protein
MNDTLEEANLSPSVNPDLSYSIYLTRCAILFNPYVISSASFFVHCYSLNNKLFGLEKAA